MQTNIDIGPQIKTYHGNQLRKNEATLLIVIFIALVLIPFFIGFYRTLYGYAQYGPVAAKSWGVVWLFTSTIIFILVVGYSLYRLYVTKLHISLHKSGLCIKRALRSSLYIPWDHIAELYVRQENNSQNERAPRTRFVIRTIDSREIILRKSDIVNLLDLITQIKASTYIHNYPKLCEQFRIGEVLKFGPIEVQRKFLQIKRYGLKRASPQFPWHTIERITIKSGFLLIILNNQKCYVIRASKIPNVEMLLQLIEDRARG